MKKCPYCGHINSADVESCEHCYAGLPNGKPQEEPKQETTEQEETPVRKRKK